jgi:hypothetical protein
LLGLGCLDWVAWIGLLGLGCLDWVAWIGLLVWFAWDRVLETELFLVRLPGIWAYSPKLLLSRA